MTARRIPNATVDRLPVYLRVLLELAAAGDATVSSEQLADMAGVNAAKVRKDLSHLGSYGTRGVGYDVEYLRFEITSHLGLAHESIVAIAGIGNLGLALANHGGFSARGFIVGALFDADPAKVGTLCNGIEIRRIDQLGSRDGDSDIAIGVICTPPTVAQSVADAMVGAGVHAILNFAPVVITVPDTVTLRKVDLTLELQVLSFYQQRESADRSLR